MKHTRIGVLAFGVSVLLAVPAVSAPVTCTPHTDTFYLTGVQPDLDLVTTAPTSSTPTSIDSPSLSKTGGNPYKEIGTWYYSSGASVSGCVISSLSPLNVWLGLRNSDDQGTKFDLKAEVFLGAAATPFSIGQTFCVTGLTRNPDNAVKATVNFTPFPPLPVTGIPEVSVKISARIGAGATCTGHASATGVRLYYDAVSRPSEFDANLVPCNVNIPTPDGPTAEVFIPCGCVGPSTTATATSCGLTGEDR